MQNSFFRLQAKALGHRQQGVALIEVLITVLVLSVGLLGLAALQIFAVQQNASAGLRSQAVSLAYDMADRVKLNHPSRTSVAAMYSVAITDNIPSSVNSSASAEEQIAQQDIIDWLTALTRLPSGDGSIVFTGDNDQMIITVCWQDTRADGDSVLNATASNASCGDATETFFQFATDV